MPGTWLKPGFLGYWKQILAELAIIELQVAVNILAVHFILEFRISNSQIMMKLLK